MSIKKDIIDPMVFAAVSGILLLALYLMLMPRNPPIWPIIVVAGVVNLLYIIGTANAEDRQKEREEKLTMAMHEQEVRMRIEAERRAEKTG